MMVDMSQYESPMELSDSAPPAADPAPETAAPSPDAPAADPKPEVAADSPAADTPPADPVAPTEELFDLPDGRKVNAAGLKAEYENLLPEFTRKSQRLAELERDPNKDINKPNENVPEWKKPDYEPKSWAEAIEIAKAEALREITETQKAEQARVAAITTAIDTQIADIRKIDPNLDENALFLHANKYGFHDLKAAHTNMADMRKVVVETEQRVAKNVKTREADPVAGGTGIAPAADDGYDPREIGKYASAAEYMASLKGN